MNCGFKISDNPIYLDTLGWVYLKRGEWVKAVTVLERAERRGMDLPEISYHLGMAYYKTGQRERAKMKLEQAISSGPEFAWVSKARLVIAELK